MFVVIVVLIMGACASIIGSFYFNTLAFQAKYGNVNSYYGAYYGAISSIERGLLMTKIKYPTYSGSGGFKGTRIVGSNANMFSGEFWRLNQGNNSLMRYVDSQTENIKSSIDTKTLRVISFYKYNDDNPNSYTGEGITKYQHGISSGLSFSGDVNPKTGGRVNNEIEKNNVDFNRFFITAEPSYTVRSLGYDFYLDNREGKDKDSPLSGYLIFTGEQQNPRAALTGIFRSGSSRLYD